MGKRVCLIVTWCVLATAFLCAQELRLPRQAESLIQRVQKFWAATVSGQRLQALEYVLPEKKELFLSGRPAPILSAKVVGLDLTKDSDSAAVRVALEILDIPSGRLNWTISDSWVYRKGNWYLDVDRPRDVLPKNSLPDSKALNEIRDGIEKGFELLRSVVDVGTVIQGENPRIEVPIQYSGSVPVKIELAPENPVIALDYASSIGITARSKNFVLVVVTDRWSGEFNLPLQLKIRYEATTVERKLVVKGNVFVPFQFRQDPPDGPIEPGHPVSVFVRNNTSEVVVLQSILMGAKFDILRKPQTPLLPDMEAEIVLRLRPGQTPERLEILLDRSVFGRDVYTYRLRDIHR